MTSSKFDKILRKLIFPLAVLMTAPQVGFSIDKPFDKNRIMQEKSLRNAQFFELKTSRRSDDPLEGIRLSIDGIEYDLDANYISMRAKNFRFQLKSTNAAPAIIEPGPVKTIRGNLRQDPGSRFAGSLLDDGLSGKITRSDGRVYFVEPVVSQEAEAPEGLHVLYRQEDAVTKNLGCGCKFHQNLRTPRHKNTHGPISRLSGGLQECEVAVECDEEYTAAFSTFGSTATVLDRVELFFNITNDQYENEVGIRHTVSTVSTWQFNDPYSSFDAEIALNEFRNYWNANRQSTHRDVAMMFTLKDLILNGDSSIAGLAFLDVVCDSIVTGAGYSLCEHVSTLSIQTDIVAHELGHNWSANHCNCVTNTMNPFSLGFNDFNDNITVPVIVARRDASPCLTTITSPANDDLENAIVMQSPDEDFTGLNNINATTEADEPFISLPIPALGSTVWFRLDSTQTGTWNLDTFGSDFDTILHVFEDTPTFSSLIVSNNDAGGGQQSEVSLDIVAGTTYYVRVSGRRSGGVGRGAEGNYQLNTTFVSVIQPADSFTVFRGELQSGGLAETTTSDDQYLSVRPGFTLNTSEAPVWLIFDALLSLTNHEMLVESQANTPNLTMTAEMFNWNSSQYETVGTKLESFNADSIETFTLTSNHFDTDGLAMARLGWRRTGFTLLFPWEISVDQVVWQP